MLKYPHYCIKRKTHIERILYILCHCLILQSNLFAVWFLGILGFNIFIKNCKLNYLIAFELFFFVAFYIGRKKWKV